VQRRREQGQRFKESAKVTTKKRVILISTPMIIITSAGLYSAGIAQMHSSDYAIDAKESTQTKIARALSAGPKNVTKDATIAEMDSHGNLHVLRPGTNGWTCIPGSATEVGEPPMCADEVAMQWNKDSMEHKPKPTNTVPGIEYMLAGATQRSDSDPTDKTDPPIKIGPHWMILWPFDPQTSGLPTTHRPTGAYIMFAGTPWAHVHVMGSPEG
jgi:hypothetical protein